MSLSASQHHHLVRVIIRIFCVRNFSCLWLCFLCPTMWCEMWDVVFLTKKLCEWNNAYDIRVWGWSTYERGDMAWTYSSYLVTFVEVKKSGDLTRLRPKECRRFIRCYQKECNVLYGTIVIVVAIESDVQVWNASNRACGHLVVLRWIVLGHKSCVYGTFIYLCDFLTIKPRG
jgi:hypothetical protein